MKKLSILIAMMMALVSLSLSAQDYVDAINNDSHGEGQRVIYEMNVGSFTAQGTLAAAQQELARLKQQGIDIVWLMPIYPRGGGINSPYAAVDFKRVNSSYGTVADLKQFVAHAHSLGMLVWLDWVPNHMATNATWVTTHPEYFKKGSDGKMIHPYNGAWGDVWQLDYSNQGLVDAMNDCLKYWVNEADIDGYRCDYVSSPEISATYWNNTIAMLKALKPGLTMMAEADMTDRNNSRLASAAFDYDYAWGFQSNLVRYGTSGTVASTLRNYAQSLISASRQKNFSRMVYLTNHDQNWNEDKHTLTDKYGANRYLLTVLAHTIYGMPLLYNGQETGGNQALNYFQDTKVDWSSVDKRMLNTVRTLNAIKHSQEALHDGKTQADNGEVTWLTTTNNNQYILAYSRKRGDSEVIVVLNTGSQAQTALLTGISGDYSLWLDSETISQGVSRKNFTYGGSLSIQVPAKGYKVYVKGNFSEEVLPGEEPLDDFTTNADCVIFYETPVDNASITSWVWADGEGGTYGGENYASTGAWPGDKMERLGVTSQGNVIYQYIINVPEGLPKPGWLIIEENGTRIYDGIPFVNRGYYVKGNPDPVKIIPAGIDDIIADTKKHGSNEIYDITGKRVDKSYRGIVIMNNKKFLLHD